MTIEIHSFMTFSLFLTFRNAASARGTSLPQRTQGRILVLESQVPAAPLSADVCPACVRATQPLEPDSLRTVVG